MTRHLRPPQTPPPALTQAELVKIVEKTDETSAALIIAETYGGMFSAMKRGQAPVFHRNDRRLENFVRVYRLLKLNSILHEFPLYLKAQFEGAEQPPHLNTLAGRVAYERYRKYRERATKSRTALGFAQAKDTSVDTRFRPGFESSHIGLKRMQASQVEKTFAYEFLGHEFDPMFIALDPDVYPALEARPAYLGPRVEEAFLRVYRDATLRAQLQKLREEICK